jgi:hypothetical protein
LVHPEVKTILVRHTAEKVNVLLVHKEIGVIYGNWGVGPGPKAQRFNFNVSVEKLGG